MHTRLHFTHLCTCCDVFSLLLVQVADSVRGLLLTRVRDPSSICETRLITNKRKQTCWELDMRLLLPGSYKQTCIKDQGVCV